MDLGWYGEEHAGYFRLYLYKGNDWHNCQLLEKRKTKEYKSVIDLINRFIDNVNSSRYELIDVNLGSIDDYYLSDTISVLNE